MSQYKPSRPKWKKQWAKVLDGDYPQTFLSALLIISLFIAESWTLGNAPDSSNAALYGILLAIFIIFCFEIVALSFLQAGYFLSFFFWMDFIGTISIILDIGWISDYFLPSGALSGQGSVIRATRAAKLGARYGRLLRLMRMMKMSALLPCMRTSEEVEYEPTMSAIKRVSEQLAAMLSQRTAALTLLLVIVVPFLSYSVTDESPTTWLTNIKVQAKNESVTSYDLDNLIRKCRNYYEPKDRQLLYLRIESPYVAVAEEAFVTRNVLRDANIFQYASYYYVSTDTLLASGNALAAQYAADGTGNSDSTERAGYVRFSVNLHLDDTVVQQQNAMFGILIIVLVIVVLVGFTASYTSSVKNLVVQPMEKMMQTLRSSALLMINAIKQLEKADGKDGDPAGSGADKTAAGKKGADGTTGPSSSSDEEGDADLEAAQLEVMVAKLSRIVRHVIPQSAVVLDSSVDQNTSNWLSQAYSAGASVQKNLTFLRTVVEKNSDEDSVEPTVLQSKASKLVLNSWEFDVLEYSTGELTDIMTYMFTLLNLLHEFQVPIPVFKNLLGEIAGRYEGHKYHNYKHGCDVCHTTYRLLLIAQLHLVFTPLEVFSLLIAAVAHDVGHPGVNNQFLVKTGHDLALRHNDHSPLENMHCVALYQVLSKEDCNVFKQLSDPEWREARKIILTAILGTDMSHHFEQISKTQLFLEVHGEDTRAFCAGGKDVITCMSDDKNRMFVMELLLHCSDISNPFKPFEICAKWADLVVEEFCLQGDREKALGLEVSPMCDRDTVVLSNMQMGFIEFVVAPLIIALVNVFPTLHEIGACMGSNYQHWGQRRVLELTSATATAAATGAATGAANGKSEEVTKLEERLQKFKDKMAFVATLQGMPQRKRISFQKK